MKRLLERNASRTFRRLIDALSYFPDLLFRSRLESGLAGLSTKDRSVIWLSPAMHLSKTLALQGGGGSSLHALTRSWRDPGLDA